MSTITTDHRSVRSGVFDPHTITAATFEPRIIADPAALGLGAFDLTPFVLNLANSGIVGGTGTAVLAIALFDGGIAQLGIGMWEFVKANTFGATAFTSRGAFWPAIERPLSNPEVEKAAGAGGVGAFLLAWTTFVALTIGAFTGVVGITRLGGWLGLVAAGLASYGCFAVVTNATWKRVLPVWPSA